MNKQGDKNRMRREYGIWSLKYQRDIVFIISRQVTAAEGVHQWIDDDCFFYLNHRNEDPHQNIMYEAVISANFTPQDRCAGQIITIIKIFLYTAHTVL